MLENIPRELRERVQFCVWRYVTKPGSNKPTKPPFNAATGWPASVTDPTTWSTFDDAVKRVQYVNGVSYEGIGYVISKDDPYTFIDLDTYDPTLTDEDRERHKRIADTFKGYAEISPSGKGLHLIVKGKVPSGRRRAGIEIYGAERYMTITGNVWRNEPIIEQQALLDVLWAELGSEQIIVDVSRHETAELDTDYNICERASKASNGPLFVALYKGEWQSSYPSQSEADFALLDILSFYTQNRTQIKRIFRASALGRRDKAKRDNYLDSMIVRSFDNQPVPVDFTALKAKFDALHKVSAPEAATSPETLINPEALTDEVYSLPPGLLGEIAHYIYASAPRPVKEVALTAAIGLMAGITGRAYNVSGTGLNQYILLLAPTGSGKEQIAHGISMLMEAVAKKVPSSLEFIGPGDIRSDVALAKYMSRKSPSFVTIGGEFGHTLSQMARESNNANMRAIKRMMLDLYGKSGRGATLQPSVYSDAEKNTLVLSAPAFSFIGESAPESFFESVDERLVADGLLPRFTLIEYKGKRPDLNLAKNQEPSEKLVANVATLCVQALQMNKLGTPIDVQFEPDAKQLLDDFDRHCTKLINDGHREVIKHIWNRAHLRSLKLAATIAVGLNPWLPVIDYASAYWAIKISSHSTQALLKRFEEGDVGGNVTDVAQMKLVFKMLKEYLTRPFGEIEGYCVGNNPLAMYTDRIIPSAYLNKRLVAIAAFRHDRRGATNAINATVKACVDEGTLIEISKMDVAHKYGSGGKCFAVANWGRVEKG